MNRKPTTQSALEHYRRVVGPDPAARARALQELTRRVSSGEQPPLLAHAPAPVRLPRSPVAWKAWLIMGTAGAIALIAVRFWSVAADRQPILYQQHAAESASTQASLQPSASAPPAIASPAELVTPLIESDPVRPPRVRSHAPAGAVHVRPATHSMDASPATPAAEAPHAVVRSDLEEEMRLMGMAHDALRDGQPERALQRLAEHAARFPDGVLAQSRQVTRIMALCQAGKTEAAREEARRFLESASGSPYTARVRTLCREPSNSLHPQTQ